MTAGGTTATGLTPQTDRVIPVTDPATDEVLAGVRDCDELEMAAAIDAAVAAQPAWEARLPRERSRLLRRLVELVAAAEDDLARLITSESGKPLAEARAEINYALGFFEWAAEEAPRVFGETIPASAADKRIFVFRRPVGVTAAITPWNFPLAMLARKLGPALAAGCTQVVKPARLTPLTAVALGELVAEAGFPAGVVNVVTGSGRRFADIAFADPRIRKVSFTGSTEVGQELIRRSADHVVRLSLELGGHAPVIVLDDADLEVAVTGVVRAKFRNGGQSCIAANRIYVTEARHDEFVAAFAAAVSRLRVGHGLDEGVDVGPLIDDDAVAKVEAHVDDAAAHGASVVCGGHRLDLGPGRSGRFFAPTVLAGVTDVMEVARDETFGPVAPILRVADEEEAIVRANASPYGLAAYVFGRDIGRVLRTVERLDCGVVGVNDGVPSAAQVPFGGTKLSGYGREGGHYVMAEYLDVKFASIVL